jgi:heat shock protein HslJ
MKKKMFCCSLTVIIILLVGCNSENQIVTTPSLSQTISFSMKGMTSSESGLEITEKYWKLVELMGKEVVKNEQMQKDPHIIFKSEGNRVNGYTGCNSFFGSYEIQKGNILRSSNVAMTRMACIDETETGFVRVLNTADSYLVKDDTLFLYRDKTLLAKFEALYLD